MGKPKRNGQQTARWLSTSRSWRFVCSKQNRAAKVEDNDGKHPLGAMRCWNAGRNSVEICTITSWTLMPAYCKKNAKWGGMGSDPQRKRGRDSMPWRWERQRATLIVTQNALLKHGKRMALSTSDTGRLLFMPYHFALGGLNSAWRSLCKQLP